MNLNVSVSQEKIVIFYLFNNHFEGHVAFGDLALFAVAFALANHEFEFERHNSVAIAYDWRCGFYNTQLERQSAER